MMFGKEETKNRKTPVLPEASLDSREPAAGGEESIRGRGSPLEQQGVSRRTLLKGGAALAGLTVLRVVGPAPAFPGDRGEDKDQPDPAQALAHPGEEVLPWLDQPADNPVPNILGNLLKWEALDSWLTPADNFFFVQHYGKPDGLDESTWRVDIAGLVARPQFLTLAELKARPRREVNFTLECSGNTGLPFAIGLIGNARWAGTPRCWRRRVS